MLTSTIPITESSSLAQQLHTKTPAERLDLFRLWANEQRDPITVPTPTNMAEFNAKWTLPYCADYVLKRRTHWDAYYADLAHVETIRKGL